MMLALLTVMLFALQKVMRCAPLPTPRRAHRCRRQHLARSTHHVPRSETHRSKKQAFACFLRCGRRDLFSSQRRKAESVSALLCDSVSLGSDVPPVHHSLPLPFKFLLYPHKQKGDTHKVYRLFRWCGRRDLNPYGVNHTPLKRARLPVPPLPHIMCALRNVYIILLFSEMSRGFCKKIKINYFHENY